MAEGIRHISTLRSQMIDSGAITPTLPGANAPASAEQIEQLEGHCVKCRDADNKPTKKTFNVEGRETMRQGHTRAFGKCPDCGTSMSTFEKKQVANAA
jgi:hypothetical protein